MEHLLGRIGARRLPFSPAVAHMTGADSISTRNSVGRVVEYSCESTGTIAARRELQPVTGSSAVANVRASTGGNAPSHSTTPTLSASASA